MTEIETTGRTLDVRDYLRDEITTVAIVTDAEHERAMARTQWRPERSASIRAPHVWLAWDGVPESGAWLPYVTETQARGWLLVGTEVATRVAVGGVYGCEYRGRVDLGGGYAHPAVTVLDSYHLLVSTASGEPIDVDTSSDDGVCVGIYAGADVDGGEQLDTVSRERLNRETVRDAVGEAIGEAVALTLGIE